MMNRVWETEVMSAGRAHRHDPGGISFVHNCRESEVAKSVESGGSEAQTSSELTRIRLRRFQNVAGVFQNVSVHGREARHWPRDQ